MAEWHNKIAGVSGQLLRGLVWFLSAVVIPCTIWFTMLRADINTLKYAQAEAQAASVTRFGVIETRLDDKEERLQATLQDMNRKLGEISGELKRIR